MGIVIILILFRTLRLPSIKVSAILLLLFFLYDIFFVFISPLLTNGMSIMEKVATGGSGGGGSIGGNVERLPITITVPRLYNPYVSCGESYSMLGFGDIILPGLLVSYCLNFDMRTSNKYTYFIVSATGYVVGLICTYVGLYALRMAQPALLYLVPCCLGSVLITGWIKKDLKQLWNGPKKPTNMDPEQLVYDNSFTSDSHVDLDDDIDL